MLRGFWRNLPGNKRIRTAMDGINYITDDNGIRKAVIIDLQAYGEQIEDFLDGLEAEARRHELKTDFNEVVTRILQERPNG